MLFIWSRNILSPDALTGYTVVRRLGNHTGRQAGRLVPDAIDFVNSVRIC